jgi:maltoporin
MNTVKKLPLAMAVVAALCPISVMAQEFTQEQIDAIVAKAVDKALADRQAKIDAAANNQRTRYYRTGFVINNYSIHKILSYH